LELDYQVVQYLGTWRRNKEWSKQ